VSKIRVAVPGVSVALAIAAGVFATLASDVTWKAIWIGLASTLAVAGLVDFSALWELRRRERAVLRIAGHRVGLIHQRLLWVLQAVFGISGDAATYAPQVRALSHFDVDLTLQDPIVTPPRSKAASVMIYIAEIDGALDTALSLGAQTAEAERFERLDRALRLGLFSTFLRGAAATPRMNGGAEFPAAAAAALDVVQAEFRFFAKTGGEHWKFGQLPM
jgi:hypothetical protein